MSFGEYFSYTYNDNGNTNPMGNIVGNTITIGNSSTKTYSIPAKGNVYTNFSDFSLLNESNYNVDGNTMIIDTSRYNGRINIAEPVVPNIRFQMHEKIAVKNRTTEYRGAIGGIWESNVLAQVFFSAENIQIIQNGLRAGVYEMSNQQYVIAPQNLDTLKIIMRSIYLQYAEHYEKDITGQVERLNKLVWDYAVPAVYNEAIGYVKYCEDQSTLVVPLEMPRQIDRNFKQLEMKEWF
jgi:hypothetical protein